MIEGYGRQDNGKSYPQIHNNSQRKKKEAKKKERTATAIFKTFSFTFTELPRIINNAFLMLFWEGFFYNTIRRWERTAIDQAHAGIHGAIYSYRATALAGGVGFFPLGQTTFFADNTFVLGGTMADLLMVDTSQVVLSNQSRFKLLSGFILQNVTSTVNEQIQIERMVFTWNANDPRIRILVIDFDGNACPRQRVNARKGQEINYNCIINIAPDQKLNNIIMFNRWLDLTETVTVTARFIMSDSSQKDVVLYNNGSINYFNFTVKSTGKTADENIYRTMRAEYNAITQRVVAFSEIDEEIVP